LFQELEILAEKQMKAQERRHFSIKERLEVKSLET
jgi:hypothetical protein